MRSKIGGTGSAQQVVVSSKYAADSPWEDTRSWGASSLELNIFEKANAVLGGDLFPWGRGWGDK